MRDASKFQTTEKWIDYMLSYSDPNRPKLEKNLWFKESIWDGGFYHGETPLGESWAIVMVYAPNVAQLLDESNWESVLADLEKHFGNTEEDQYCVEGISHWLTRLEYLMIKLVNDDGTPTEIAEFMFDALNRLDDYPVYDDDDYSEREYESNEKAMLESIKYGLRAIDSEIDPDSLLDYAINGDTGRVYYDEWWDHEGWADDESVAEIAELYCAVQWGIPPLMAFYGI